MELPAQNLGLGAQTADLGAQVRARGQRAKAGLAGGRGDHAAGHGALGGPGLRGAERRREVPAAGKLPQLLAVLDSWAGRPSARRWSTATHLRPGRRAQAQAYGEHALHAGAGQTEAEGAPPLQVRVVGHHAGHQPQQAHGRERSGKPGPGTGGSKLLELEVIHIDLGENGVINV